MLWKGENIDKARTGGIAAGLLLGKDAEKDLIMDWRVKRDILVWSNGLFLRRFFFLPSE